MIFYVEIEEEEPGKETSVPGDLCREFGFDPEKVAYAVGEKTLLLLNKPTNVEVNLKITGDEAIRQCNLLYRQIDSPTDVLSFPGFELQSPEEFDDAWERYAEECTNPESGNILLGDIMINARRVKSQAEEYGHSEKREFAFLVAHSMLHLLGYDHGTEEEGERMEKLQESVLRALGITRDS